MRKIILLLQILVISISNLFPQQRQWDRPMQLKRCFISINADLFTATTFVEMEFYNPNETEIEGLYRFQLQPGQVITAFQLDLHGKYRDGTIEEKWKARNAYNTIVGKRIDPALLQMEGMNNYRLNIYPVPAKGSRKITMTIQQRMKAGEKKVDYLFSFGGSDTAGYFKASIKVHQTQRIPFAYAGLLANKLFNSIGDKFSLNWESEDVPMTKPVSFSIPLGDQRFIYCTKQVENKINYALLFRPSLEVHAAISPKKITVYWDVSASADSRQTGKEINFLQQYISSHDINRLTIIPFNRRIIDTAVFYTGNGFNSRWQQYIRSLDYDGATQLGMLDFSSTDSDVVFLFSDGRSTYGKQLPKTGNALVFCINTSASGDPAVLKKITGAGGGCFIDLHKKNMGEAISMASLSKNWLLNITSSKGRTVYEQQLPLPMTTSFFINGTMGYDDDTLTFFFGTNNAVRRTEKLYLNGKQNCSASAIERINMLEKYELITKTAWWEDVLEFGIKEKVVTPNTSYIVLERVEDYIKYNITPPKDLEDECIEMGFVKKDSKTLRQQMKERDEFEILNTVVRHYNEKLNQWDKNSPEISITRQKIVQAQLTKTTGNKQVNQASSINAEKGFLTPQPGSEARLEEVVVIGYSAANRRSLTGSVVSVKHNEILPSTMTIGDALAGRVAGLQVTQSGSPGLASSIRIRGSSSLGSNNQPLFVIDGMPVSGNINDFFNVNNIESITVLKDATATALYGSRGVNGIIVIESKKAKPYNRYHKGNSSYSLKDMEDVSYLQDMKSALNTDKWNLYLQLKASYGSSPGFYFDMAQHFFDAGMKDKALPVLMNAAEAASGDYTVLKAIGYTLENWNYFAEAVEIYSQVLDIAPMNLYAYRDLAWAYYRLGEYQEAVNLFYKAIKMNLETQEVQWHRFKAILLSEMNAVIAIHKDEVNTGAIPAALIIPMLVDLRIVVDGNKMDFNNVSIQEPGGTICSNAKPVSKKGGYLNKSIRHYYDNDPWEYQLKQAIEGKYRISVNHYDYGNSEFYPGRIPSFVRITTFRNFGKENQSISLENVIIDNQHGTIEIGEVKWE